MKHGVKQKQYKVYTKPNLSQFIGQNTFQFANILVKYNCSMLEHSISKKKGNEGERRDRVTRTHKSILKNLRTFKVARILCHIFPYIYSCWDYSSNLWSQMASFKCPADVMSFWVTRLNPPWRYIEDIHRKETVV